MFQLHPYQKELVNQAREKLADGHKSVLLVSPAGSGKSVIIAEIARLAVMKGGHVMFTVHRKELIDQITKTFIANGVDLSKCTIMTVGRIARRLGKLPKPTLIITDETHHSLAKTYLKIYGFYKDVPRLGFSASPWRLSGKGLGDVYETMVEGPTVKWLIEHHYLAPFDYYAPTLIDVEKLKKSSTGDYSTKSIDEANTKMIFGDVVSHYQNLANGRQAIIYAHSIEESKRVAATFNAAGISAIHVDSKTPALNRDEAMTAFKDGKIRIISNVDLISEGFDVPECGVVIMLRPTASLVLDIQQSMRGMRYRPNKRAIIIDHVANVYRFGLPDADREWSLKDRPKQEKRRGKSDGPAIKSCPKCYGIVPAQVKQCPLCGYSFRADGTDLEVDPTAKLKKVDKKVFKIVADYSKTKYGQMKAEDAESPEDMYAIAKARGYKPGWAYHQIVARGWLKERKRA